MLLFDRPEKRLTLTVNNDVLGKFEGLRTHPSVAAKISRVDLKLHGRVYKFESGDVFPLNPEHMQFVPIADLTPPDSEPNITMPRI